jgi:uncharacterized repeat protein (TIGR03803 family)
MRVRLYLLTLIFATLSASAPAQTYTESVFHTFVNFNGTYGGQSPESSLIQASDGNFYGTTNLGGVTNEGTIYKISLSGAFTKIYDFCTGQCTDGANPAAALLQGTDGNFYGTTSSGSGSVFQITPAGVLTTLVDFSDVQSGAPIGNLIEGTDGNLYVSALAGSGQAACASGCGAIYKVSFAGEISPLYSFCSQENCADGSQPNSPIQGADGNFYGTTQFGGANTTDCPYGCGTVFKLTPSGTVTTLYNFCSQGGANCTDGYAPAAGLVQGSDGNFYGTTSEGGNGAAIGEFGTVFKITPSGGFTLLCGQSSCTGTGSDPQAQLAAATDGKFYGIAGNTIFNVAATGSPKTIYTFCMNQPGTCTDGKEPSGAMLQANDGDFYGTTQAGGANPGYPQGTIYKLAVSPALQAPVQLTLSKSATTVGNAVTLSWSVHNAFSDTMQRCAAFVQGGTAGSGGWSGVQAGTFNASTKVYSGSASISPTQPGTFTYALTCGGIESGFATLTVTSSTKSESETSLTPSPTHTNVGLPVTLTATVTASTGIPTGSVAFSADGIGLGSATLNSNGVATFTASSNGVPAGAYPVVATYSGASNYDSSASSPVTVTLLKAITTTTLAASPSTVTPPGEVTLTATVSRQSGVGIPTGTVTFSVGTLILGSAKVNGSGIAALTASSQGIAAGTYSITAKYSGDSSDNTSTSSPTTVIVQR